MKPLKLVMTAFGPYAQAQEIDFSELGDRSFFLINGPTGAGKTTILDAICFALYGDTSGMQREGKAMRSAFAHPSEITSVQFDFSIGESRYRILRYPTQDVQKKSGQGMTTKQADATCWQTDEAGHLEVKAAGYRQVNEAVIALLGFKSEQFRQVVLLPQGDFRKLLTSGSNERQEIMEVLFKTERFRRIEDKLKAKANELKTALKDIGTEMDRILHDEAECAALPELTARHQTHLSDSNSLLASLKELGNQLSRAQTTLSSARLVEARFQERDSALSALKQLEEKLPSFLAQRQRANQAEAADSLIDAEHHVRQLKKETAELAQKLELQKAGLESARAKQLNAEQNLSAEKGREAERTAATEKALRLSGLRQKMVSAEEARSKAFPLQAKAHQLLQQKEKAEKELARLKEAFQSKSEESQRLAESGALAPQKQAEWERLQFIHEKKKAWAETQAQYDESRILLQNAEQHRQECETNYRQASSLLTESQREWLEGQAVIMAEQLAPGAPCPVCGSTHHPQPANRQARLFLPTAEDLKQQEEVLRQIDGQLKRASSDLAQVQVRRDTLANRLGDLRAELKDQGELTLEELGIRLQVLKQEWDAAQTAKAKEAAALEELSRCRDKMQKEEKAYQKVEEERRQADMDYRAAAAVVVERLSAIPPQYQKTELLEKAVSEAEAREKALKAALEGARLSAQKAAQALSEAESNFKNIREQWEKRQVQAEEERSAFSVRMKKAGFEAFSDYSAAKLSPAGLDTLKQELDAFSNELNATRDRTTRAQEAVANLTMPDIPTLEKEVQTLRARHEEQVSQSATLRSIMAREERWLARLNALDREQQQLEKRYATLGHLADIATGNNDLRISFQRFVLSALLDDVTLTANERLKSMTRNRYLLQRREEPTKRTMAGGLDLEVFDNYSGSERPANTLSGGETFLAALSLALGLADVVQSYAGGLHLDTIFIDEGFGTLDPESLDFAINTLILLKQSGRLVGIISHVPELKERIDARLEVVPVARGSEAHFVIG